MQVYEALLAKITGLRSLMKARFIIYADHVTSWRLAEDVVFKDTISARHVRPEIENSCWDAQNARKLS